MGGNRKKKVVPAGAVPQMAHRVPKRLEGIVVLGEAGDYHPVWRLSLLDLEFTGTWSWSVDNAALVGIVEFLTQMERLTWREIRLQMSGGERRRGPKHKPIPVEHVVKEAQDRLRELQLDDFDELFRFRTGNMERLWGVLHGEPPVFYPIWWDPDHKICP